MDDRTVITGKIQPSIGHRRIRSIHRQFQLIFRGSLSAYIVIGIPSLIRQPIHCTCRTAAVNGHISHSSASIHSVQRHLRPRRDCTGCPVYRHRIGTASQGNLIIQIHLIVCMSVCRCCGANRCIGPIGYCGSGFGGRCIQLTDIHRICTIDSSLHIGYGIVAITQPVISERYRGRSAPDSHSVCIHHRIACGDAV